MAKAYATPPIIEAVCEFLLTPEIELDSTICDLIYEEVKDNFPIRELHKATEVKIEGKKEIQEPEATTKPYVAIRLLNTDKNRAIHIDPVRRSFAVICLNPYPGWNALQQLIVTAFNALIKSVHVETFKRIGLRYINRIEIPKENDKRDLKKYFQLRPFIGRKITENAEINSFTVGCVLPFSHNRDSCRIQLSDIASDKPNFDAFILDIDYFLTQPRTVDKSQARGWVVDAHNQIDKIFEWCITDSLRKIFKG
jgi:uncharacterized protein (TIGR04255 family)